MSVPGDGKGKLNKVHFLKNISIKLFKSFVIFNTCSINQLTCLQIATSLKFLNLNKYYIYFICFLQFQAKYYKETTLGYEIINNCLILVSGGKKCLLFLIEQRIFISHLSFTITIG